MEIELSDPKNPLSVDIESALDKWQFPRFSRYEKLLRELTYDVDFAYEALNLDPSKFDNIDSGVTAETFLNILGTLSAHHSDPAIGIKLGETRNPKDYELRYYTAFFSETLQAGLKRFFIDTSLMVPLVDYTIIEHDSESELRIDYWLRSEHLKYETEIEIISLVKLIRSLLTDEDWNPNEVHLTHGMPVWVREKLESILGCMVVENAAYNSIYMSNKAFNAPLPHTDARMLEQVKKLQQFEKNEASYTLSLCDQTRLLLAFFFKHNSSIASITEVAEYLSTGVSAYQKQLQDEDASFREIRNKFVIDLCQYYFLTTKLSTKAVSDLLGYKNPSAFHRFVKSLTGYSPMEFREKVSATG